MTPGSEAPSAGPAPDLGGSAAALRGALKAGAATSLGLWVCGTALIRPGGVGPWDGVPLVLAESLAAGRAPYTVPELLLLPVAALGDTFDLLPSDTVLAQRAVPFAGLALALGRLLPFPLLAAAALSVVVSGPWPGAEPLLPLGVLVASIPAPMRIWRAMAAIICPPLGLLPGPAGRPDPVAVFAGASTALLSLGSPRNVVDLGLIPPVFAFLGLAAMGPARPSSLASLAGAFLLALLGAAREGLPDRPPAVQLWAGFGPALVVAAAFATWDRGRRFLLGCAAAVLLILGGLGIPRRAHGLREIDPRVLGAWSLGMRSRPDLASFLRCGALPSEFQGPCRRGLVARLGWAAAPPLLSRTDGVTEALLGLLPQTVPDAAEPEWRREVFFGFGLRVAWPLRGGVQEGLPRCRLDPGIGLDHRDWCEIAVAWSRVRDGLTDHELLADLPLVEDGGRPLFARGVGLHARGILRPEAVVGRCRRVLPPKWQDLCARGAAQWSRPFAAPPRP